jgi:cell division protein FtsL
MAGRYGYQYETSPRKLKPEYDVPKKASNKKKSNSKTKKETTKKKTTKSTSKATPKTNVKVDKQKEAKSEKVLRAKTSFSIFFKCVVLFAILFLVIFRNSQISESFSQIQKLKASITELQKENDQIEISIQNNINANNIEQKAKELLGMQKLSNKQIVYISLSKKDYVEPRTEEVIVEEEKSFLESIIDKIKDIF